MIIIVTLTIDHTGEVRLTSSFPILGLPVVKSGTIAYRGETRKKEKVKQPSFACSMG